MRLGKIATELPDGFYLIKDGVLYSLERDHNPHMYEYPNAKKITIPQYKIAPDDELQHVEYDAAQCGYEK